MELREVVKKAALVLDSKKAHDIKVLDLSGVSSIADYFVIASANNPKHAVSLSEYVEDELEKYEAVELHHTEGQRNGDWVILDYMDVIVHVFSAEKRAAYGLDEVWKDAVEVEF